MAGDTGGCVPTHNMEQSSYLSNLMRIKQDIFQGSFISPTQLRNRIKDISRCLSRHIIKVLHTDDLAAWWAAENMTAVDIFMQEVHLPNTEVGKWQVCCRQPCLVPTHRRLEEKTGRLALRRTLANTRSGANSKNLPQLYKEAARWALEHGSPAWHQLQRPTPESWLTLRSLEYHRWNENHTNLW